MQKLKLLKLADHLESLPRKKFNIEYWCKEDSHCGTVACAFGWCPVIFPRSGLKMIKEHGEIQYTNKNGQFYGARAASEFFDIYYDDACSIFLGSKYPKFYKYDKNGYIFGGKVITPKMVAKRIRHFVKTGQIK